MRMAVEPFGRGREGGGARLAQRLGLATMRAGRRVWLFAEAAEEMSVHATRGSSLLRGTGEVERFFQSIRARAIRRGGSRRRTSRRSSR